MEQKDFFILVLLLFYDAEESTFNSWIEWLIIIHPHF